MIEVSEKVVFQRVVVPLERETFSRSMLESAAEMAQCLGASLVGLYVEDEDLLKLADLPIVQEVSALVPQAANLSPDALARQFRGESLRMQHLFNDIAERRQLRHEFMYRRGHLPMEIHSTLETHDILATGIGRQSLSATRSHFLSCSANAVFVIPRQIHPTTRGAVGVVSKEAPSASHIIRIAADIAFGQQRKLAFFPQHGTMSSFLSSMFLDLAATLPELTGRLIVEAIHSADQPAFEARPALVTIAAEDITDEEEHWIAAGVPLFVFKGMN